LIGVILLQTSEEKASHVLNTLTQDHELSQFVDISLPIPKTFKGVGTSLSHCLGQDPPIKKPKNVFAFAFVKTIHFPY
jgi:hypothetical protein